MPTQPAYPHAAEIEASLELMGELCADPTPMVYARMFELHPHMEPYFWRDTNNSIKGEMLARTFSAILDFVGERQYAHLMISTEMITHEGYDVPRDVFATFFSIVRDTVAQVLGPAWTPALAGAWREMLGEMDRFAKVTPKVDVASAFHAQRVAVFQAGS